MLTFITWVAFLLISALIGAVIGLAIITVTWLAACFGSMEINEYPWDFARFMVVIFAALTIIIVGIPAGLHTIH